MLRMSVGAGRNTCQGMIFLAAIVSSFGGSTPGQERGCRIAVATGSDLELAGHSNLLVQLGGVVSLRRCRTFGVMPVWSRSGGWG